jgi:hypothetical protein
LGELFVGQFELEIHGGGVACGSPGYRREAFEAQHGFLAVDPAYYVFRGAFQEYDILQRAVTRGVCEVYTIPCLEANLIQAADLGSGGADGDFFRCGKMVEVSFE